MPKRRTVPPQKREFSATISLNLQILKRVKDSENILKREKKTL